MSSVWIENTTAQKFDKLKDNIDTDVLIVGGGITGILCAYFLKEKGIKYALVEAKRIGYGITHNTTAKITSQHGLIYNSLIQDKGIEKAKQYFNANQLALEKYKELSRNINCDFEEKPAFVYSTDNKNKIQKEVGAVNRIGFNAKFIPEIPIPIKSVGAVKFDNQAQFNPLKFIYGISKELNIYENTFVKDINKNTIITNNGKITAKKIIIATHFPFINTHGSYYLKMYQHRSYVIALENAQNINGMYVDEKQNGMSFRNYEDLLLIGGGDHRTGEKGGGWAELRNFSKQAFPKAHEKYSWATQDCMTLDNVPYIGNYSKLTPDLYVATGFNKWGISSAMVSAMILSDMVLGKESEFSSVFSPSRSMITKQLFINGFEAVKNLLNFSSKRCPHMGCSLKWNSLQHSWDCPCHGSRFDKNGNVIDNPAMKGIKFER